MFRILFFALVVSGAPAFALDLQGHRGARGLAPENTLPAFAAALTIGVGTLEFDTAVTKDGVVIIAHDRRLNPEITKGPDGRYLTAPTPAISALTLAEAKRYDVGAIDPESRYAKTFAGQRSVPGTSMPTLGEVAALVRRSGNTAVRFNVETKLSPLAPDETLDPEAFATTLVAALRSEGLAARATIQSFDWRTLKVVQRIAPEIQTSCLTIARGNNDNVQVGREGKSPWLAGLDVDDFGGSVPRVVKAAGCAVWSPFFRDVTPQAMAEAKANGLTVAVWTVNDRDDMLRMIEMGADAIITDYPDRLRGVMAEKGLTLPPAAPVMP
ncbi:MAG TPA: glycerophosphodiester phosphodiesterase [Alphaproteobacteria bacterium]|nr:glycerophosphodiester phosphodiesterase [Alphaproteobacteria bacterium]